MAVLLNTSLGDIVIDLYTDQCPLSSKNFLKLCKIKYYNNCVFHSVQKDFIAQTGDPTGTGSGGDSIYKFLYGEQARFFNDEIHPELKHDKVGKVAMASAGENLNASQFYITTRPDLDYLDGKHTVFGEVAEGLEALMRINEAYVDEKMRPYKNIRIKHTYILEDPFEDPVQLAELIPENSPELKPAAEGEEVRLEDDWIPLDEQLDQEELEKSLRRKEAQSRAVVLEMVGDIPEAEIKPPDNVLFVCKLNPITEEEDLEIIFSRFGKIISADIIRDYKTGDSLCYAFIEFETQEACEAAYFKMDNVLIDDRRIHVDFSQSVAKLWTRYRRFGKKDKDDGEGTNFAPQAKGPGCFNCGEFGHFAKDCPNQKPQVQEKPKYKLKDIEGQHGHGDKRYEMVFDDISDDPRKRGQPPEKEFRKRYPDIENVEGDTDDRSRQSSRSRKGIDSSREDDLHHKSRDSQRRSHGVDKSRHDRDRHWQRVDEAPSRGHHDSSNKRHSQRHDSEEDNPYHRHYDRDDKRRTKVHAEEDDYSHRYQDRDGKERSYREGAKEPDQSGNRKDKRHRQREDTEVGYYGHKGFDEGNKQKKQREYSPPKDTQVRGNSDGYGGGGSKGLKDHHRSRDHGRDDRHDSSSLAGRRKDHPREEHRSHRKLEEHSRHRDASRNDPRSREN